MTEGVTFRGVVGDKDATGDGGVGLGGFKTWARWCSGVRLVHFEHCADSWMHF